MATETFQTVNFKLQHAVTVLENPDHYTRADRAAALNNVLETLAHYTLCAEPEHTECTCTNHLLFNRLRWLLANG